MIESANASLVYLDHGKEVFACRDISIQVKEGEFLGILGPSGSGKSSLLYLLSGLKIPTSGDVRYQNQSLVTMSDQQRSHLRLQEFGFVFQQAFLLGYLTVLENILLGATGSGPERSRTGRQIGSATNSQTTTRSGNNSQTEAIAMLEKLGVADKLHRRPHELSGGERQRVCVARALLGDPKILFADEPTASLDHKNGEAVVELLNQHRGQGSLVMVTHDATMLAAADRIVRLVDGALEI